MREGQREREREGESETEGGRGGGRKGGKESRGEVTEKTSVGERMDQILTTGEVEVCRWNREIMRWKTRAG